MSKLVPVIAFTAVGCVLFAGTYLGVAAVKGVSVRDMPPLTWLGTGTPHGAAPVHPEPAVSGAPTSHEEQPVVPSMTAGVLGAFVLPSPFDSRELQELQTKLAERLEKVEAAEADLARRAADLDDWQKTLEGRTRELAEIRAQIEAGKPTPALDPAADAKTQAADDPASWRAMAPLFAEGDAEDLAGKLATFAPEEAALVLKALEPERAAELLNALPKASYKPFLDAWRLAKD